MTMAITAMAKASRITPDQAAQSSSALFRDVTLNMAPASQQSAEGVAAYIGYFPAGTQGAATRVSNWSVRETSYSQDFKPLLYCKTMAAIN